MSLSRAAVTSVAALCGAMPELSFTLTTSTGSTVRVAEHADARLCAETFRALVREWVAATSESSCLDAVEFDAFDVRDGILTRAGERWIVSPLDALATAECIRGIGELEACLEVLVREDAEFGVTVARFTIADHVTMASPRQAEHLLDDAALAAYAACLAEELMRGASATSA